MASFESIFQAKHDYHPDTRHADAALKHRKEFGGKLFFDRIWENSNVGKAAKSYPPKTNAELKDIWKKILDAKVNEEQKLGLQYYLIRDCRNSNLEKAFLHKTYLPEKYQYLVTGLWEVDHCQFSRALEYLTDPTLIPATFADEVLSVLLQHPKSDQSQAMAYYLTVQPPLQDQNTLDAYFDLLSRVDVTSAYNFARQHPQHQRLFEKLVESIQGTDPSQEKAATAVQLIGLPFSDEEVVWFEDLLAAGTNKTAGARDTLLMRQLATEGSLNSSLARYKGTKIDGVNWEDIQKITSG